MATKPAKKAAPVKKIGRPTVFTQKIFEVICTRLADGEPLRAICRDPGMPSYRTVYKWKEEDADLNARIARAREAGFDALAEQCLAIADDETHDWQLSKKGVVTNEVAIGRARLQVETRLKLLAKWSPKKYGDKVALTGDGGGPIQAETVTRIELVPLKK